MDVKDIEEALQNMGDKEAAIGMAKYGINPKNPIYGVSIPNLRMLAKKIGRNQNLSIELWETRVHEARILSSMIAERDKVDEGQMDSWVKDFDSWDICDQTCNNLFVYTPFAWKKALEWSKREREFEKRAGFVLMATLAVHDKKVENQEFINLLPVIKREASDSRNFVKKAVNWALRQIGKRSVELNKEAISSAKEILQQETKSAKWIARDALKELQSKKVQKI